MTRSRLSLCLLTLTSAGSLALSGAWAADKAEDLTKKKIEFAPRAAIAAAAPVAPAPVAPAPAADDNPRVAPGKVNWHASFEAACEASKKSGKPVLLFQLLGQLDKQFC